MSIVRHIAALEARLKQAEADRETLRAALKPIAESVQAAFKAHHAPPHCALGLNLKVEDGERVLEALKVKP